FTTTGDFDGDGLADVAVVGVPAVTGANATVRIYRSTGTSLTDFGTSPTILTTATENIGGVAVRDLDGDGHADVIVTETDLGSIAWWNGIGNGQFLTVNGNSRFDRSAGPSPTALALGDVGGNALPDVVVANSDQPSAQLSVLTNNSQ